MGRILQLMLEADPVHLVVPSLPLCSSDRVTCPMRGDSFFKGTPGADLSAGNIHQFSKGICGRHVHSLTWVALREGCPFPPELRREEKGPPGLAVLLPSFCFILTLKRLTLFHLPYPFSDPTPSGVDPCQVFSEFFWCFSPAQR